MTDSSFSRHQALGLTSLHILAQSADRQTLEDYLDRSNDAFFDATDYNGFTALQIAAHAGNHQTLLLLLQRGRKSSLVRHGRHGFAAFHIAAQAGRTSALTTMIAAARELDCLSSAINQPDAVDSAYTPLHCAIVHHHIDAALLLLDSGADWSLQDAIGHTALHLAVLYGDVRLVRQLLSHASPNPSAGGASGAIDIQDKDGCTALLLSLKTHRTDIARLLLHHGAKSTTVCDNTTLCPLFLALDDHDLLRTMLSVPDTDLSRVNSFGLTAIHIAVMREDVSLLDILLTATHPSVLDTPMPTCSSTPLHCAATCGAHTIVEKLLHHGADVNQQDAIGWTPLHRAVAGCAANDDKLSSHAHIVVSLLKWRHTDVNIRDHSGWTPLHMACLIRSQVLKTLLTHKNIDLNAANAFGLTPLHVAIINRNAESMEVLLAAPHIHVSAPDAFGRTPLQCVAETSLDLLRTFLRACPSPSELHVTDRMFHRLAARQMWTEIAEILKHLPTAMEECSLRVEHIKNVLCATLRCWRLEGGQQQMAELAAMRTGLQGLIIDIAKN